MSSPELVWVLLHVLPGCLTNFPAVLHTYGVNLVQIQQGFPQSLKPEVLSEMLVQRYLSYWSTEPAEIWWTLLVWAAWWWLSYFSKELSPVNSAVAFVYYSTVLNPVSLWGAKLSILNLETILCPVLDDIKT